MSDMMTFPATVEEFMEQYKIVDDEKVYTNGADLVPIFRMMQWLEHVSAMDTISRQAAIDALKNDMASLDHIIQGMSGYDVRLDAYVSQRNQVNCDIDTISNLPPAQPEPCEDAVSRKAVQYLLAHFVDEDKYVDACDGLKHLPHVTPKQPDCAKCKSELANKIRGQQDNPGMLTENDKGRNWGLEWAAQIVEGKRK